MCCLLLRETGEKAGEYRRIGILVDVVEKKGLEPESGGFVRVENGGDRGRRYVVEIV